MRVLVIEDERVQRDNLVKIEERSYINTKAYSAANIKEAKEILTSKEIDLFFIDINLPDGSGLELAKSIREIEKYEHTGIVFITTQVIQIIDAFKSTHCYDFLIKPFNNEDIKSIIDTFYRKLGNNTNINRGNYLIVPIENGVSVKVYEDEIIFVEYASASVSVKAMFFYKVNGTFGGCQPCFVLFYIVISIGADKSKSSLEPHGFGGVHQAAVAVNAGVNTSIDLVQPIFQPEWHDIGGQIRFI